MHFVALYGIKFSLDAFFSFYGMKFFYQMHFVVLYGMRFYWMPPVGISLGGQIISKKTKGKKLKARKSLKAQ